eukprot:m.156168 g.156168  ORF g.156168 m.156168 type:complete len:516 (+) comp20824_c0_seq6:29-1576(+)
MVVVFPVLLLALLPCFALCADQPSFLFILADDIGWGDFGYNTGIANTPNLDKLAASDGAIRLNDFHSGGTVCSPTRASVLTGRTPFRDCVFYVYDCSDPTECEPNFPFAPNRTFTVADAVAAAGKNYQSGHFGKWHLGSFYKNSKYWSSPIKHGFTFMNSTLEVAPTATTNCNCKEEWKSSCIYGHDKGPTHCNPGCCFNYWWKDNEAEHGVSNLTNPVGQDDSIYIADAFKNYLQSLNGDPFVVQLSFHNCHIPFIGTEQARQECASGKTCKSGQYNQAELDYYACMNEFDASVGRVLQTLTDLNYRNNTMVWFASDNGPEGNCPPLGHCGPLHSDFFPGMAGPLRGRKRDTWEGGHRVPGIISWPARIKGNHESNATVITHDFLPTVMDILQVERPAAQRDWALDGTSILPLVNNPSSTLPPRGLGWLFTVANPTSPTKGFRYGPWKLVHGSTSCTLDECNKPLLYNLDTDMEEKHDLAEQQPEILKAIQANFTAWYESVKHSYMVESRCPNL